MTAFSLVTLPVEHLHALAHQRAHGAAACGGSASERRWALALAAVAALAAVVMAVARG